MDTSLLLMLILLNVNYVCCAKNVKPKGKSSSVATKQYPTTLPVSTETTTTAVLADSVQNLTVSNVTSSSFIISWELPSYATEFYIERYVVYINCSNETLEDSCPENCSNIIDTVGANQTVYIFQDATAFTTYYVTILPQSNAESWLPASTVLCTDEDFPDKPEKLSVSESNGTLSLEWDPPRCSRGVLLYYDVTITCKVSINGPDCPCPPNSSASFTLPKNNTKTTFAGVHPYSEYSIAVAAGTKIGVGNSNEEFFNTTENVPGPPVDLKVSSDFNITWKQPLCPFGILQMYYVIITFLQRVENSEDCYSEDTKIYSYSVSADTLDYQFTEWKYYSKYIICVHAATSIGNGTDNCCNFQSPAAVLDGPRDLEVKSLNSSTANITWKNPCPITDKIVKFSGQIHGHRQGFKTDIKYFSQDAQFLYLTEYDLKPEYKYRLEVYAFGSFTGYGINTSTSFQQPAGIPSILTNGSKELRSVPLETHDPTRQALIFVPTYIFDSTNGDINYYAIYVSPYSFDQSSTNGFLEPPIQTSNCSMTWPKSSYWGDISVDGIPSSEYQATPDCWQGTAADGVITFLLGADTSCGSHQYCNGPLKPYTEYTFKVRAFTSHGFQDSNIVPFHTDSEVAVGLALGLVFGFLMAGTVLFGYVMYRKGQISCSLATILKHEDTRDVCPRPIPLKNYTKHCELLLDIPGRLSSEFQLLCTLCVDINDTNTFSVGRLPDNKRKNRYINILPFDANRVKLEIVDDDPSSDYINASFIQGYSKNIEYIATQGPKEETVKDFWLMVYQYGVNIIVMVTQLEEQGKVKCHQYYPNLRETAKYGDISVRCTTELQFSIYTSRTIILTKGQERKKVVHLHFREWPDFGCPVSTVVMLQFCQTVRHQILLSDGGLTLVHCSAGVGRTGTLIALDILLQHIKENKTVDIFGVVYNLRKQRTNMVQSEAQYEYVYKCVRDALGDTVNPKPEKSSTSSLEPICESEGPVLNTTILDNPKGPRAKSNVNENEYEM